MCGIVGKFWQGERGAGSGERHGRPRVDPELERRVAHRGPDHRGEQTSGDAHLVVYRLAIIGSGEPANQPLIDPTGRYWLACNGEIYNWRELRASLPWNYRGDSDCEVLIPLLLAEGPEGLGRVRGRYALVFWDSLERRLVLARDPAGECPLFYRQDGDWIHVASEPGALPHTSADTLDRDSVTEYFHLGYCLEPRTMGSHLMRVRAGTVWERGAGSGEREEKWDGGKVGRWEGGEGLRERIEAAVDEAIEAPLPIGIMASGGVDSSLLAALAVRTLGPENVILYTVRFADPRYDESAYAVALAEHLGTPHVMVEADDLQLVRAFTEATRHLSEPVADPALLPTWLLAEAAARDVKVILSGEGADELFGGYPTYPGHIWARRWHYLPAPLRVLIRALVTRSPNRSRHRVPLSFLLRRFVEYADLPWAERHLHWFGIDAAVALSDRRSPVAWLAEAGTPDPAACAALPAMRLDFATWLRNGLLVKIDRACMAHGLESRAPYLDPLVVDAARSLPERELVRGLRTKIALKLVARDVLPRSIVERRKRGLSVPTADLIAGPLREEAERLLSPGYIDRHGMLEPAVVRGLLSAHLSGEANNARALWAIMMFQAWYESWWTSGKEICT